MTDKTSPKLANKFHCETCHYKCCKQSDYEKHIRTLKHQTTYTMLTNTDKNSPKLAKEYRCKCGNTYKHRQSLHKHHTSCKYNYHTNPELHSIDQTKQTITDVPIDHACLTEKIIELVMSKNQEFMNVFMDKIVHMLPSINGNHNSITTNNTNNQFNIQMFLNEVCRRLIETTHEETTNNETAHTETDIPPT